ncbi:hypothetical protein B0H21DRAFT_423214 [Amylocystis lapponica]|nr:hypothetical protein B0H21DRAFT_423214 [Amylocystis lapponica]
MSSAIPFSRPASPGPSVLQLGWYGLGTMGQFMARNLANYHASQYPGASPLLVYNRSAEKCQLLQEKLGAEKVKIAASPAELVLECDVIFTSLANDTVARVVYQQFADALSTSNPTKRKVLVEMSTTYPSLADELVNLFANIPNVCILTGPVFGPPASADAANLICVLAGEHDAKKDVAHILVPAIGRKVLDLGEDVRKGPTFKLIGNSMILNSIEILGEAFTITAKAGIDATMLRDFVKEMFPAPILIHYATKITNDDFDGGKNFAIDGGIKDAGHMRRLVSDLNSPMPTVDSAYQHLLTARAQHAVYKANGEEPFDILDWSGLVGALRIGAGLDPFYSSKHPKPTKD